MDITNFISNILGIGSGFEAESIELKDSIKEIHIHLKYLPKTYKREGFICVFMILHQNWNGNI